MSKPALIGLTAFPPTGYVGINLLAVKQNLSGLLKGGSYALGVAAALYTHKYMSNIPAQVVMWILLCLPPWYVFDFIQVIDTHFSGFKNPMKNFENVVPTNGEWILTPSILGLILGTLTTSMAALILNSPLTNMIFPNGSVSQYISVGAYGGGSALILAGLAGALFSSPQAGGDGTATSGMAAAPVAPPVAPLVAPGAPIQAGGFRLPPLSSFLKYKQTSDVYESATFLSILGTIFVGGIILSTLRAKSE